VRSDDVQRGEEGKYLKIFSAENLLIEKGNVMKGSRSNHKKDFRVAGTEEGVPTSKPAPPTEAAQRGEARKEEAD